MKLFGSIFVGKKKAIRINHRKYCNKHWLVVKKDQSISLCHYRQMMLNFTDANITNDYRCNTSLQ